MSSTLYTVGTALRRAHDGHLQVNVLVEGQWLCGSVAGLDGHGVILELEAREHSVVRLESIAAVRVRGMLPTPWKDAPPEPTDVSQCGAEYVALEMVP